MKLMIHSFETAPEPSRGTLAGIAGDLGFVPNLAATVATSPALLDALMGCGAPLPGPGSTPCTAKWRGWRRASQSTTPTGSPSTPPSSTDWASPRPTSTRCRAGNEPSDPIHAAVYALAQAVVADHGQVPAEVVDRANRAGLDDEAILEVVAECTFAGLVGTIDNLADRVELDGFLAPRAWSR